MKWVITISHFDYLPEPTVRKFDHVGYLAMEISLKTLEFEPAAQAARKAIARSEDTENSIPALHRIISAVGVDPQTQELWIAIGTLLMRFDKDGQRLSSFRTYLPYGARLEAIPNPGGTRPVADRRRPPGNLRISKTGKTSAMNFTGP